MTAQDLRKTLRGQVVSGVAGTDVGLPVSAFVY